MVSPANNDNSPDKLCHTRSAAYSVELAVLNKHQISGGGAVYGHFGPKTLQTQDISAPCVWCRSVSHFCVGHFGTSAEMSQTLRHYSAWDTSDPELKDASSVAMVFKKCRPVGPPYVRCSNIMEVLGKRLTVGEQSPTVCNEHNRCRSRALSPHWAEMRRR